MHVAIKTRFPLYGPTAILFNTKRCCLRTVRGVNPVLNTTFLAHLLPMASFALVGAITPGPVNVWALRHGVQGTRMQALCYVLGASISYVLIVAIMGLGAAQLQQWLPQLAGVARWLCAAYLLYLAWQLLRAPVDESTSTTDATSVHAWRQAFVQGWAIQGLNPKAWLFALSAVGVFTLGSGPSGSAAALQALALLCAVSLGACMLGVGCWAVMGTALARWLHTPARKRCLHRVLAGLLVISIVPMLA